MVTTKYCQARISQIGLSKRLLALEFGRDSGDKLILNKKAIKENRRI